MTEQMRTAQQEQEPDEYSVVRAWAKLEPLVKKAFIFGSRARDDHTVDSDLDVAIEVIPLPNDSNALATWIGESDRLKIALQAQLSVALHLELFDASGTPTIALAVRNDGVLVYDRGDSDEGRHPSGGRADRRHKESPSVT